jgi:hypothetical protein
MILLYNSNKYLEKFHESINRNDKELEFLSHICDGKITDIFFTDISDIAHILLSRYSFLVYK